MPRPRPHPLTGGEAGALMAAGELDVEVRHQRVDVVVALHLEAEGRRERQLLHLHRVDVHLLRGPGGGGIRTLMGGLNPFLGEENPKFSSSESDRAARKAPKPIRHAVTPHFGDNKEMSLPLPREAGVGGCSPCDPPPLTHLNEAGIGNELLGVHHVDEGLLDGHVLDAGHVEAVDVLPPWRGIKMVMGGGDDTQFGAPPQLPLSPPPHSQWIL